MIMKERNVKVSRRNVKQGQGNEQLETKSGNEIRVFLDFIDTELKKSSEIIIKNLKVTMEKTKLLWRVNRIKTYNFKSW